ncbi:hypothetical protein IDM32_17940 [Acinetobacter seifertii]|nr:hypothetical protein [Acinetobacter seifertii]
MFDRQTGRPICRVMAKPVSDSDKMALNNTHVHHLIYVRWHRWTGVNLTAGCM